MSNDSARLVRLRYAGPTDTRGSRIIVSDYRGGDARAKRRGIAWDHALGIEENYRAAFRAVCGECPGALWMDVERGYDVAVPRSPHRDDQEGALEALREVVGALWPLGDADREWSPDTLDDIAAIVEPFRPPPRPKAKREK